MPEDGSTDQLSHTADNTNIQPTIPPQHSSLTDSEKPSSSFLSELLIKFGLREKEGSLRDALQEVLDDHAEEMTSMPHEERQILANVMDLGDMEVEDIMIPQSDINAVEINTNLNDLRDLVLKSGHTRIPVYENSLDSIKGFIHVKDLLPLLGVGVEGFHIDQIMREVVFVPEVMKVPDLLLKMRLSGVHLAIVVDEYGGTNGLVTLEDLFEQIVGDIHDEHDDQAASRVLRWSKKGTIVVDAKSKINDLAEALAIDFAQDDGDDDDYDTLGGLIFYQLGRVPEKGEIIKHGENLQMEVLDVDDRRVIKVRLARLKHQAAA